MKTASFPLILWLLLLVLGGCATPNTQGSRSENPHIEVGRQSSTLSEGATGYVVYSVSTSQIPDGVQGAITWFTSLSCQETTVVPQGIQPSLTPTVGNAARIIIKAGSGTVAGCAYFQITMGSVRSTVQTLIVSSPVSNLSMHTPFLDVQGKHLGNVTTEMDFSLDSQKSWTPCSYLGDQPISLSVGDHVYVRIRSRPTTLFDLGTVSSLGNLPDFLQNEPLTLETQAAPSGTPIVLRYRFNNIGAPTSASGIPVEFFMSSTPVLTPDAISLGTYNLRTPAFPMAEETYYFLNWTVPPINAGTYYVLSVLDPENSIPELTKGNNVTRPECAAAFIIEDTGLHPQGAFKIMNSWGNQWARIPGNGHYWITYDALKALKMAVYFIDKDLTSRYHPTVQAVFQVTGPLMDKCQITFGVGNPEAPLMKKVLMTGSSSTLFSGNQPFPSHSLALDLSEFAPYLNDQNLFMSVSNYGSTTAKVGDVHLEFRSPTDQNLVGAIGVPGLPFVVPGGSALVPTKQALVIATKGSLNSDQLWVIQPQPRALLDDHTVTMAKPTQQELAADQFFAGVSSGPTKGNLVPGVRGTGYQPPTEAEWLTMQKVRSVIGSTGTSPTIDVVVDHSKEKWFPPVGDQGQQGSCVAFATTYYTATYATARTNDWDLSSVTWGASGPTSNLDKILSPAFVYNQVNSGLDRGCSYWASINLLRRIGASSWSTMPYSMTDYSAIPSEAAYREAGKYRIGETSASEGIGYLVVATDGDVNLLKSIVASGYCVIGSIEVTSSGYLSDPKSLYSYLDSHDVISTTTFSPDVLGTSNHAQTLVGFKDGTAWDPSDPDR